MDVNQYDPTGQQVLLLLVEQADDDGFAETSGHCLATKLNRPKRSIQGALQRLEARGEIARLGQRSFVVVRLAQRAAELEAAL